MWVTNGRCEAVVYSAWDMGSHKDPISSVLMKVGHCQEQLIMWNKKIFGNVRWNLAKVRKKLENAEACSMGGGGNERLASLNEELQNLMALEECMWSQRAKLDYLQYGDQNTKYFHCRALERNKRNYISSIENDAGVWTEEESQVGDILLRFNSNLFSLANPTHFDSVLSGVEPRVTKAMNSDFVKPFEGSYAWKSILQSHHVIDVGAVWRIGDGCSVQIREDNWIPSLPAAKIISPPVILPLVLIVSSLIDYDSHSWKVDLIRHDFLPYEANLILGIPLSDRIIPDKLLWLPSINGSYTTRSAYRLAVRVARNLLPSCSSQDNNHVLWTGIWKLQVPHRVKNFLWRASHNALPTSCNLWRRSVISIFTYSGCLSEKEDTMHALWYCSSLLVIWKDDAMLMKLFRYKFHGFDALLALLFSMRDQINMDLLAMIFWLIWHDRNSVRLKEHGVGLYQIREKAKDLLVDFLEAQVLQARPAMPRNRVMRWSPPIRPLVKINFDVAFFKDMHFAGIGIVI
nr:putative ribonuclease h protein [Quercus suber]